MPALVPLIGWIVTIGSTAGWIWWETTSEPEPVKKEINPLVIVLIVAVVLVIIYRIGKKVFNKK